MPLTPAQLALRENKITASFLPQLMKGDDRAIFNKWLELIGDPKWTPEDFTDDWPVQFGSFIETFALDWHQRRTGKPLTRRGDVVVHPRRPYFCCTLDAFREDDQCAIDCKACGAYMHVDDILRYYTPQLVGQKGCTGARRMALLLVHGGAEPREIEIEATADYIEQVWNRVDAFQLCVENLTQPVALPEIVPPEKWRTVNLLNDNDIAAHNWSGEMLIALGTWLATEQDAKAFEASKERVKELLPADVGTILTADVKIARDRRNAVSIRHRRQA